MLTRINEHHSVQQKRLSGSAYSSAAHSLLHSFDLGSLIEALCILMSVIIERKRLSCLFHVCMVVMCLHNASSHFQLLFKPVTMPFSLEMM